MGTLLGIFADAVFTPGCKEILVAFEHLQVWAYAQEESVERPVLLGNLMC